MVQAVSALGRHCGLQQLPDLGGRTYMMPGRIIPEMAASLSIPHGKYARHEEAGQDVRRYCYFLAAVSSSAIRSEQT